MKTLERFLTGLDSIPTSAAWLLADLGEARGKQELFVRQSPQKLKALKEHALIESAISSNRIEGIEVDRARIGTIVFGKPPLRDRNEEEVRGYRDALKMIHERALGLIALSIDKTAASEKGNVWTKPWISSDENEPDALSFGLEGRRGTDPDEVAHWLEVLNPLHEHASDEPK